HELAQRGAPEPGLDQVPVPEEHGVAHGPEEGGPDERAGDGQDMRSTRIGARENEPHGADDRSEQVECRLKLVLVTFTAPMGALGVTRMVGGKAGGDSLLALALAG